ncbi:hypothetical protein JB92DRAFT_2834731 [Gautieria morchelliformis]|nr:hypothetical protein JB92DRAFT_2834731 [Gautieria morchelliformis]
MSLEAVNMATFNLMEALGLTPASLCHAYQRGEWRVHQMDTHWKCQITLTTASSCRKTSLCPDYSSTMMVAPATKSQITVPIPAHLSTLGPRQWPTDFDFIDVVKGLEKYNRRLKEGYTQQKAFQDMFGIPYVWQTLSDKCQLLKGVRTDNELLYDTFYAMGHVNEARWPFFESKPEGKIVRGSKRLELLATRAMPDCESEEGHSDQAYNKSPMAKVDTTSKAAVKFQRLGLIHLQIYALNANPSSLKCSPWLDKFIKLYIWYRYGYAPDRLHVQEHGELLWAIHDMEADHYTQRGSELNWLTKLDKQWMGVAIIKLKLHCETLIAGAPITNQFIEVKDMIESGHEDIAASMPP